MEGWECPSEEWKLSFPCSTAQSQSQSHLCLGMSLAKID